MKPHKGLMTKNSVILLMHTFKINQDTTKKIHKWKTENKHPSAIAVHLN
jgi:hypothetical protein